MSHPNRNWRKAWRVDPAALTAVHESGVRVVGKLEADGSVSVEADGATLPSLQTPVHSDDVVALGRALGRRIEEGARLLYEVAHKPKLP